MSNWINGAIKRKGALHKELGVPQGEKIPKGKIEAAAKKGGKEGQRARLALTLEGFHKGGNDMKKKEDTAPKGKKKTKAHHHKLAKHHEALAKRHREMAENVPATKGDVEPTPRGRKTGEKGAFDKASKKRPIKGEGDWLGKASREGF